jgi:N-acetylglucosaminyldiphosphoundecaprenol N-acetyl-beta-D-mannosaminyltransferase
MDPRRVNISGVPVDCIGWENALAHVDALIARGTPSAIFAVNPEKIVQCGRDPRLKRVLESASLLIPDGIGAVLAARLLHRARIARVPGCELMPALCAHAAARGRRVFLFGGAPGVADSAAAELVRRNPGLAVAGTQHGYVDAEGQAQLIARINALKPDMLFVALGSPRQEFWIAENLAKLDIKICQAVGGTFDVLAGRVKRAPRAFRAMQLEWLFRLLSQPRRALRQTSLPIFAGKVVGEYFARLGRSAAAARGGQP